MAATGGNISQRIALEGAQEILKSLSDIGVRGQAAFKQLQDAVSATQPQLSSFETAITKAGTTLQRFSTFAFSDVFKNFGDNFKIGKSFDDLGTAAGTVVKRISEVALGATAAAVAIFGLTKRSADITKEMADLAAQSGTTIEEMSGLKASFIALGGDGEILAQAFKKLSLTVATEWDTIQKSIKNAAALIITDQLAVKASALAVGDAQLNLFNAQQRLAQLSGVTIDPQVAVLQQRLQAVRQVEVAENRLAEAEQKAADAAKKQKEDQLNSIASISSALDKITSGVETFAQASIKANLTLPNIITGLVATAGPAADKAVDQFKNFRGSLNDIANAEPTVQAVFFKIADFFKASGNAALNSAIAYKVFGRGVGIDTVEALTAGSLAIQANIARLKSLGLVLTEADKLVGEDFHKSFKTLASDISTTSTQIGNIFAPIFTAGMKAITSAIETSHGAIISWAQAIANKAAPAVAGFIQAITGIDISRSLNLSPDQIVKAAEWQTTFQNIGTSIAKFANDVKTFFLIVLPEIFAKVLPVLQSLADGFEKLTGIKLSAEEMGLVLIGTQILGINGFVLDLIKTFGILVIAAVAAFGSAGLVGLATAAFAAFAAWDFAPIVSKALKAWDEIKAKWQVSPVAAGQAGLSADVDITAEVALKLAPALGTQGLVVALFAQAVKLIKDNFGTIVDFFAGLPARLGAALSGLADVLDAPFAAAVTRILGTLSPVAEMVRKLLSDINSVTQSGLASGVFGFGGNPEGAPFARGGMVWGPGSSTSDSILARLSRGEFVMRAAAVEKFGPAFFAALNGLRLPRFNLGGLVDDLSNSFAALMPLPAFAGGGFVAASSGGVSGRPIMIPIGDGGPPVRGVIPQSGAKRLERLAVQRRIRSAGRKPGWF